MSVKEEIMSITKQPSRVPFTEEAIKAYLDKAIKQFREIRDAKGEDSIMMPYYIDAYQSVRTSLFDEILE